MSSKSSARSGLKALLFFALVGETLAIEKRPVRLERVGRREIKNIGMQWNGYEMINRDVDVRDLCNAADPFNLGEDHPRRVSGAR